MLAYVERSDRLFVQSLDEEGERVWIIFGKCSSLPDALLEGTLKHLLEVGDLGAEEFFVNWKMLLGQSDEDVDHLGS